MVRYRFSVLQNRIMCLHSGLSSTRVTLAELEVSLYALHQKSWLLKLMEEILVLVRLCL